MSIKTNAKAFWTYFLKNKEKIEEALQANDSDQIKEWEKKLGDECLKTAGCYLSLEKDDELNLLVFEPMIIALSLCCGTPKFKAFKTP